MMEGMETGDSVHVESSIEMFWSNPDKLPCRILLVRPAPGAINPRDSSEATVEPL